MKLKCEKKIDFFDTMHSVEKWKKNYSNHSIQRKNISSNQLFSYFISKKYESKFP